MYLQVPRYAELVTSSWTPYIFIILVSAGTKTNFLNDAVQSYCPVDNSINVQLFFRKFTSLRAEKLFDDYAELIIFQV